MTEKELQTARIRYKESKIKNEEEIKEQRELKRLLSNPKVQRYIHLTKKHNLDRFEIQSEEELILNAFGYARETIDDNHLYVYVGAIKNTSVYLNLETRDCYYAYNEKDQELFEDNNTIIELPNTNNAKDYMEKIKNLRVWFFNELLQEENSQTEVVEKLKRLTKEELNEIINPQKKTKKLTKTTKK